MMGAGPDAPEGDERLSRITTLLIDFGGVLAEEGFQEGLRSIGRRNGLASDRFFRDVDRIIAETGYLTGNASEENFWDAVRRNTGIAESDTAMRNEILQRFVLRTAMLGWVDRLRAAGLRVAILSDQTNWLEEIDASTGLFRHFDGVFNSYRIGKSKRDGSVFSDVCSALGVVPSATLFVDDNPGHIERAKEKGLQTHLFKNQDDFARRIEPLIDHDTSL